MNKEKNLYIKFYWTALILLMVICNVYEPFSYSFSNYSIGNGRFDDFFNIYNYTKLFPGNGSYCITPWQLEIFSITFSQSLKNTIFISMVGLSILLFANVINFEKNYTSNLDYFWVFTYPLLFCFWRGNTELFAFSFLFYAIALEIKNKNSIASINFLMIACLIKPNYIVFLPLFINYNKDYIIKIMVLGVLYGSFALCLMAFYGDISTILIESKNCITNYKNDYIIGEGGLLFNNSYWGVYKIIDSINNIGHDNTLISHDFNFYNYIWQFIFILVYIYSVIKLPLVQRLLLIMLAFIVLNPISADYRLIVLIAPLYFMQKHNFFKFKVEIIILLLIILPKHFYLFKIYSSEYDVTINSLINPILISFLILRIIFSKKGNREDIY